MELKDIKSPRDIKGLAVSELREIAEQMRQAVLNRTSKIGGHVGSNLGDVEAIIALHYVFDAPDDKLVFDVSHQDFPHKMLTGRADGYLDEASFAKVGEYTDPSESPEYDLFYAGHTSPALSLCCGLAKARDLKGEKHNVVAFVGDGSLSGGEAFEGLDAGGALGTNLICVLNDNQMAIAENHGGMYAHLRHLRETGGEAPDNIFKAFGWDYRYVAEGNDIEALIKAMEEVKGSPRPVVLHINTQKGEGYAPAEEFREEFHWSVPFDIATGHPLHIAEGESYEGALKNFIMESAEKDPSMLVISSATPGSFGLGPSEREKLGERYIDVAIAEQTGVSVMAGAARGGVKVIYPVVASFLQRAYDQLVEDWAMNASPATLVVLASGIKGIPDKTHLGFWDIPMITSIPDIVYLAPTNIEEYEAMLRWSLSQDKLRVAIRQPTYSLEHAEGEVDTDYSAIDKYKVVREGTRVAIVAAGDFFARGREVADLLAKDGVRATLINPRYLSGVDVELLRSLERDHEVVATIEDGSIEGGFGQRVASALGATQLKVLNFGLPKRFADRYDPEALERECGLAADQIVAAISDLI
ncbi:MAG: 1-deoxy-D-xylulose-5-phosphate synthase [[Clostridium] fimetarium]|nr:1-deoxy-D-xylulose-5-phosphate synthase [Alistipes timonensis]MCM1404797.1 1-deoxy-D-xylulose-5-phosphate synthase [[Clostridium] fimetarium]